MADEREAARQALWDHILRLYPDVKNMKRSGDAFYFPDHGIIISNAQMPGMSSVKAYAENTVGRLREADRAMRVVLTWQ